jgi:hypothetical protein
MSLSDAFDRVPYGPLSSDRITKDAYVVSFPVLDRYRISSPELVALDGNWNPPPFKPV